jgi:hypothetical protein
MWPIQFQSLFVLLNILNDPVRRVNLHLLHNYILAHSNVARDLSFPCVLVHQTEQGVEFFVEMLCY